MIQIASDDIKGHPLEQKFQDAIKTALEIAFLDKTNQTERLFKLLYVHQSKTITVILTADTKDFIPQLKEAHDRIK